MSRYEETASLTKSEVERWNFLLSTDIDEMSEEEKEKYGARRYDQEAGFYIDFADGSNITFDLCSGSENYYDEIQWHKDGRDVAFDCLYEIGREPEEFTVGDDTYVVNFEVAA